MAEDVTCAVTQRKLKQLSLSITKPNLEFMATFDMTFHQEARYVGLFIVFKICLVES